MLDFASDSLVGGALPRFLSSIAEVTSFLRLAVDWETSKSPVRLDALHTWVFFLSVVALVFYYLGSRRFYRGEPGSMRWLGIGILADSVMAVAASFRILPVLLPGETIPYQSIPFMVHMISASLGMMGFIIVFVYVLLKGQSHEYPRARAITYMILFPVWTLGAVIGFINFLGKFLFQVNLYSYA